MQAQECGRLSSGLWETTEDRVKGSLWGREGVYPGGECWIQGVVSTKFECGNGGSGENRSDWKEAHRAWTPQEAPLSRLPLQSPSSAGGMGPVALRGPRRLGLGQELEPGCPSHPPAVSVGQEEGGLWAAFSSPLMSPSTSSLGLL